MLLLHLFDSHLKHLGRCAIVVTAAPTYSLHHPQIFDLRAKLVVQVRDASLYFFDLLPVLLCIGSCLLVTFRVLQSWTGLERVHLVECQVVGILVDRLLQSCLLILDVLDSAMHILELRVDLCHLLGVDRTATTYCRRVEASIDAA